MLEMMRIELIKEKPRFAGTLQSSLTDSNRRPPPYHGTPSATGRNPRQPFSPAFAVSALPRFATDCHWLQPRGFQKGSILCFLLETHLSPRGFRADRRWVDCSLRLIVRQRYARRLEECASRGYRRALRRGLRARARQRRLGPLLSLPGVVALARTVLAERIARAQQAGVVLALGRRRADQSGIGQGPFRPGCHFGNVAYASFGDVVSSSTPAPCRRASSERG